MTDPLDGRLWPIPDDVWRNGPEDQSEAEPRDYVLLLGAAALGTIIGGNLMLIGLRACGG